MKKIYYILIGIILGVLLVGCRSKKSVSEKQETVRIDTVKVYQKITDTIFKDRVITKTKPVYFETEIPCDSNQTGKVGSGNNFTEYRIKDGRVFIKTNIDSISNVWQEYYRSKTIKDSIEIRKELEQTYSKVSETKVYVYPWWIYALIIGCILFAGLWVYQKFLLPIRL
ncbi:hypothetical protein [Christiangramia crocea]|uniref:Lipoprotein n=1 Tax=Christiangramia crocea TaxID=2904124 RepID=A0A9X1UVA8_9FLAO|nr:hypothetical protein [Gramella crocea]MCG9970974.1 hypothetical protein [Gramella crocea]